MECGNFGRTAVLYRMEDGAVMLCCVPVPTFVAAGACDA